MQNEDDAVEASTSRLEKPEPMDTSPLRKELPDNDAVGIEDNLNGIPAASNAAGGQVAALSEKADLDQAASRDQGGDGVSALAKDSSGHAAKEFEQTASEHRVDSEERGRTRDESRSKDRKQKSRERDRGREREKDREKERSRSSRKDKDRDRDRDRKDSKRAKGDDRDGSRDRRDSKKSRRSRSREKSRRRDSRDRRSSRRSPSGHRRRSRSRGRRRSSSRDRNRRRSYSRERGFRGRRRSFGSDSDDGFGGYVPRKRQEAPQAAAGFSTAFVDPYAALRSKQPLPTDPEGIKREMAEQQLRARQMVLQQQAASAVAAASKTQREIYVGNLVQGLVTEDALRQLFNSTMKAAFPEQQIPGMDPVVTVSMHSEGRYAFVELRTPDMASAALQLSGQVQLLGQSISVGRPSGYVDPSAAQMAAAQAATALSSFELGQSTLQEATEAMNTISMPGVSASQPPGASPSPQAPLALPAPPPLATTPYLQIVGMVTAEVLADDEEYSEVIEDIQEECGKYGKILSILVPRPSNPATSAQVFGQGNYGKAFVHFEDANSCQQSKDAVHGRLFAGVSLQASFISEKEFQDSKVSD